MSNTPAQPQQPQQPQPPKVLSSFTLTPKPLAASVQPTPSTTQLPSTAPTTSANAFVAAPTATTSTVAPTSTFRLTPQPLAAASSGPLSVPSTVTAPSSSFTLQPKPITLTPQTLPQTQNAQPAVSVAPSIQQPVAQTPAAVAQPVAAPAVVTPAAVSAAPVAVSVPAPAATPAQPVAAAAAPAAAAPAPAPAPAASAAPPCPTIDSSLEVVDDEKALEQCLDWSFFVELVEDVLRERDERLGLLQQTIASNDHLQFQKESHALKGAALNLHLPALVDITKKAEIVGKQLVLTPNEQAYLAVRQPMVEHLKAEYARLEAVLPEYRKKAEEDGMDQDQE